MITPQSAPPDAAQRRGDIRLALGLAAVMSVAWTSVLLVKVLSSGPMDGGLHSSVGLLVYAVFEHCGVWALLAPIVWLHRRLPVAAAPAPGLAAVATASGPLAMLALLATLSGSVGLFAMLAIGQFGVDGALTLAPHIVVRQGTLALLLLALAELRLRHERATAALHDSSVRSLALRRELDAARLAVLSAQIEPHFLFNTLANVRRLLRTEPPAAQQLLGQLRRYLEEALPLLRESHSTLGREAELVRAYLGVHQVRMGPRLAFEVDVPEELGHHPLPPMLLLTLVENALKHGLAPQVEGGTVHVQARRGAGSDGSDELVLTVADTGRGMGAGLGSGTGLANLRARLRTQHGPAARLSLHLHEPRGVRAEVRLPWAPLGTPS